MRAIVMLHSVDDSDSILSVGSEELERLIAGIRNSEHAIVPMARLLEEPHVPNRVALTFDDGFASVAETAAPILCEAGCAATLFVTTGHVGGDNRWPTQPASVPAIPMMDWRQIEALAANGWEIGAHTITHPDLRVSSDADLERELAEPKREIERHVGRVPDALAYPYGALDCRVVAAARRHYRHAVTARLATLDGAPPDPHLVPRLDAYYLRSRHLQCRFGRPGMRAYLRLRALLRRARGAQ